MNDVRFNRILRMAGARWDSVDSDHLRLYTESSTYAASHLQQLSVSAENGWAHDMSILGVRRYPYRLRVFYFESADAMQAATGVAAGGATFPEAQLVTLQAHQAGMESPPDEHEIMHALSLTLWGLNARDEVWEREGLATVATAHAWMYSMDEMAAQARRDGDLRSMLDLSGAGFQAGGAIDRFRAYMLSGSFVQYLIQVGGVEKFRTLWQHGVTAAQPIYGASLATLTERWDLHLHSIKLPAQGIDLDLMRLCGRTPAHCAAARQARDRQPGDSKAKG